MAEAPIPELNKNTPVIYFIMFLFQCSNSSKIDTGTFVMFMIFILILLRLYVLCIYPHVHFSFFKFTTL